MDTEALIEKLEAHPEQKEQLEREWFRYLSETWAGYGEKVDALIYAHAYHRGIAKGHHVVEQEYAYLASFFQTVLAEADYARLPF